MKFKVYNCLVIIFSVFIISCSKDSSNDNLSLPSVVTLEIDNLTYNSVESGGSIISNGGTSIISCGVVWSTNENPTINDFKTTDVLSVSEFTSSITNLEPNTTYYLKAYATNSKGTSYGNQISFTTNQLILPVVNTISFDYNYNLQCEVVGEIITDNGIPIITSGFVYNEGQASQNINLNLNNGISINNTNTLIGNFFSSFSALMFTGSYVSVRAFATNSQGTSYGNVLEVYVPHIIHVGDQIGGGTVFLVIGPHLGLVVAEMAGNDLVNWGCLGVNVQNTFNDVFQGEFNSDKINNTHINAACNGNFAVNMCLNLTQGGYNDWYLPSKDELNALYDCYSQGYLPDLQDKKIWSSTQYDSQKAWSQTFNSNGTQLSENKDISNSVIAIRTFSGY